MVATGSTWESLAQDELVEDDINRAIVNAVFNGPAAGVVAWLGDYRRNRKDSRVIRLTLEERPGNHGLDKGLDTVKGLTTTKNLDKAIGAPR